MRIGVLALQGAFAEHLQMLKNLGIEGTEIRQPRDLEGGLDGLIIPGGESTTIGKLLRDLGLFEILHDQIKSGMPVFGTCAGLILLAEKLSNDTREGFKTMEIEVMRNAYGRQLGSFNTSAPFGERGEIPMVFIRAPYVEKANSDRVQVLASVQGKIVAVRQENQLAVCFHPELTANTIVHEYFIEMVTNAASNRAKNQVTVYQNAAGRQKCKS